MTSITGMDSPYKGLVPYSEEDAQFFFGREAEREIIEANLIASRLTLFYGPSGVGKSSVLRAGVVYHLRTLIDQYLRAERPVKFIVAVFNAWRDDPIKGLTDCIEDAIVQTFRDRPVELPAPQASLTETLLAWAKTFDVLIILDQFEEYFLYHPPEEGNAFDSEFPRAVNYSSLRANFLISMREDGLSKLDRFKGRIPNIFNNYLRLENLEFKAARDAITKPIEQYNKLHPDPNKPPINIEPALIDAVLTQVKKGQLLLGETGRGTIQDSNIKGQVETPYLQLVMIRLWEEDILGDSRTLQLDTLERLGGAQSIVKHHLDRVMRTLKREDQVTATDFFQYLITPSGSKIAYPVADLIKHSERSQKDVENILKTLEDERVLRQIPSSVDDPDTVRYEIFHDVLALAMLDWRSRLLTGETISQQVSEQVSLLTTPTSIGTISVSGDVSRSITIGSSIDHTVGYTAEQASALLQQISTSFRPKPFDGHSPYKGMDYYDEIDAELFFGREKLVEDLVDRLKESRTLFVTGPSGSGKSSLVRAGLIHTLRQGAIKGSQRWLYATMKPGREPLEAMAIMFSRLKSPELGDYFLQNASKPEALGLCAESVLSERQDQRLVVFIDQFEEVFTLVSQEQERQTFITMLVHAGTVKNGRVIVLFAMRSDFIPNCAVYPALNELLSREFRQIGAMQPEELVSAIAQPALRVGLRIEPDLISRIINDMQGEPGALPLMQFTLKDLFNSQQAQGGDIALTLNDYLQRGGILKALARHADNAFSQLSIHEQDLARSIFSSLIEIGRGTQDTRRIALFDELVPAGANIEEVATVVQKLADARLITTDETAGKDTVTISHEKLIDAWPWLQKLVNENRELIALQNEIALDAKEWDDHKRDPSYLYSGARLANAVEKIEASKLVLSSNASAFVEAGRAEQQAMMTRQRLVAIGLVASLIINGIVIFTLLR